MVLTQEIKVLNPVLPITANYYVKYNIDPTGTPVNIIPVGGVAPNTLQTRNLIQKSGGLMEMIKEGLQKMQKCIK